MRGDAPPLKRVRIKAGGGMLTGPYRRLYHYHLKKCGGSTMNRWLDTLTSDDRVFDAAAWKDIAVVETQTDSTGERHESVSPSLARTLFHWSDVVHNHGPLRIYAPTDTFCLTVLRNPVQRLLSQVSDWRRLTCADTANSPAPIRDCVEDSRRLGLADFLQKHAHKAGRSALDNYMTRALAEARAGIMLEDVADANRLTDIALVGLERDYDLVGLTERLDATRNALCSMIGLPPARAIPTVNATYLAEMDAAEVAGADDILERLTRLDRFVYDRACQLFQSRHGTAAERYDTNSFESRHASRLLAGARGCFLDGATRYSVRAPIIGSGFHGRDGSGLPECAVWSGPETRTTLYIPVPPNMALSLLVWMRGYVEPAQRDTLRVRADGVPVVHGFGPADGYADLLTAPVVSQRDFVRLEIDVSETLESGTPGTDLHDARKRGFSFDGYGWRPL